LGQQGIGGDRGGSRTNNGTWPGIHVNRFADIPTDVVEGPLHVLLGAGQELLPAVDAKQLDHQVKQAPHNNRANDQGDQQFD
jgi:hypothetical protein